MATRTRRQRKTRCMEHRRSDALKPSGSYFWCNGCGEWEKRGEVWVKIGDAR